jgi:hypothetical protein
MRHPFTVILDAGHGGTRESDPLRVTSRHSLYEGDLNLSVVKQVAQNLQGVPGLNLFLTRESDSLISLEARAQTALAHQAHLFISVHHNFTSFTTCGLHHPMVFTHQPFGDLGVPESWVAMTLLRQFGEKLTPICKRPLPPSFPESGLVPDFQIYPEGFYVLRKLQGFCPAVITEAFFASDAEFEALAYQGDILRHEAQAISDAIRSFMESVDHCVHTQWLPWELSLSGDQGVRLRGEVRSLGQEWPSHLRLVGHPGSVDIHGSSAGTRLQFELTCSISQWMDMESLVLLDPDKKVWVLPDRQPIDMHRFKGRFAWSDVWTPEVETAVLNRRSAGERLLRRVELSLRLFPNHPFRLEAMLYLTEQSL